jgi:hypothetical protein
MTVKQLKEKLAQFPDNMEVYVAERKTEFSFGLVNSVSKQRISFSEDPDSEELAEDDVVVIDEE